jgi:hypothetical protein
MRFKAREIWAGTLGTITLFYQLVGKGNDELYLFDILLGVIINAGIGFLIGTAITAINSRRSALTIRQGNGFLKKDPTPHQTAVNPNQLKPNTATFSELSDFLGGLPGPLNYANEALRHGWFRDPLKRWSSRFNQGQAGEVGWTNRVLNETGQEILDDLATRDLKEADLLHPIEKQHPSQISPGSLHAGWFEDTSGFFKNRYWNGRSWTLDVKDDFGRQIRWESNQRPSAAELKVLFPKIEDTQQELQKKLKSVSQLEFESKEIRLNKIVDLLEKGLISRSEFEKIKLEIFPKK